MKTVAYYKSLGLIDYNADDVFVNDFAEVCDASASIVAGYGDGLTITYFAWRENTGVKPEFSGLVEIMVRNGGVGIVKSDSACWAVNFMDVSRDLDIIKWRPSLNQSSIAEPDNK
jgi:hypothetical protein